MGNRRDQEKVPEIPYSGALKKLFEVILDANFPYSDGDVNVGRKYRLQQRLAVPRQWHLELYKLPKDCGFGLRVAVNAAIAPGVEPAFVTLTNVSVTDVKLSGSNIIVWVENSSGSVANLVFNFDNDKFQARLFTESVAEHDDALKQVQNAPFLVPDDIRDLNGDARKVTRVLRSALSLLHQVNRECIHRRSLAEAPKPRKRNGHGGVDAAPSRDTQGKGKAVEGGTSSEDVSHAPPAVDVVSSGQLPTGVTSLDLPNAETPVATKTKRRKVTPRKDREMHEDLVIPFSPMTTSIAEIVETPAPPSTQRSQKSKKERLLQHPRRTGDRKDIDFEDRQDELRQFKNRVKPIFAFGPETLEMVSVEQMEFAPPDVKYRPYHESLGKSLLEIFLTALHPQKQTLTLMPVSDLKPTSYEDVKDGQFYIINGQHSWAAAKMLIASPFVSEEQKNEYKTWKCDFVWTKNLMLLSELSLRINNTNQHRWNSPEYLLHIQYARDLWIKYGMPESKGVDSKKFKDFQRKAVETLNSMTEKNATKTSAEYQGEFRVICADIELYDSIMKAFRWYESGDLVNPDSGIKWRDELEGKDWTRKFTVAYTFKCVRSLGRASLVELVEKITVGLTNDGGLVPGKRQYPKVYMAANKPKRKYAVSLKEWTDRKKAKNAIVRWLSARCGKELWSGEDVNADNWRAFKEEVGFTSAHMDELIRRATKKFLSKYMKVSDNPRRQQNPPPDAFTAEVERVLMVKDEEQRAMPPVLAYLQTDGNLSEYCRERSELDDIDQVKVSVSDMPFSGGILDMRMLETYAESVDETPISILSTFSHLLTLPPYWMVISHSNKSEDVREVVEHFFQDWDLAECKYVPAAAEKYFFSTSILKLGNGVVIFLLGKNTAKPLYLGRQIVSQEEYKKVGEVREYVLEVYSHELRMEVYLDFINQAWAQDDYEGVSNFLFITAGRKPMIAAVMSGFCAVAVVIEDTAISSGEYLKSHRVGCRLQGFKHLFDTALETDDSIQEDVCRERSTSPARGSELRSKMRQENLEESSEDNVESGSEEEEEDDVGTFGLEGSESHVDLEVLRVQDASPAERMYKKSAFAQSVVDTLDVLDEYVEPSQAQFPTPSHPSPGPVVNCPPASEDVQMLTEDPRALSSAQEIVPSLTLVPKEEPDAVSTPRMESNKDDPIVIDSDEEDHIISAVRDQLPSDDESDLSEGPAEEAMEESSEQKLSAGKALRIQLRGISKSKLSVNRASLLKSRQLEIQNMKLLQQLAAERKLREQADERLRSCGLGLIPGGIVDCPSGSAGRSFQATTSIASAPEISLSEAELPHNLRRRSAEDFIAGTQESTLLQRQGNTVTAPGANSKGLQGGLTAVVHLKLKTKEKRRYHSKNRLNGYVSDEESSSPEVCNFRQRQPKYRICISKLIIEDIDEVTSSLKE